MMHDELTPPLLTKPLPGKRVNKPAPLQDAVTIQRRIVETIKDKKCHATTIALLSKSWLELEEWKRKVRGKSAEAKVARNGGPGRMLATFEEPGAPAADEPDPEPATGSPTDQEPDPEAG